MSRNAWEQLIERYSDGRVICNCGDAYYSACGEGYDGQGNRRTDLLVCRYGCQANQLTARSEIAQRVLDELKGNGDT